MRVSIPTKIRVLQPDDSVREIDLEDYTRGVTSAALPADTPLEAFKAQAVAARTFGVVTQRHAEKQADVCTTRHCQVWLDSAISQVARAVDETRAIVLTYEDKLIHAFYFEHCDGHTREARGILIEPAPYCRAVPCPCGFATLRGHGIGLCQRGAAVMARSGDSYEKILLHYFSGVALVEGISVTRRPAPTSSGPVILAPTSNPLASGGDKAPVQHPEESAPPPISKSQSSPPPVVSEMFAPASPLPEPRAEPSVANDEPQTPATTVQVPVEVKASRPIDADKTNVVTPAREVAIPPEVLKKFARPRPEREAAPASLETTAPPPDLPEEYLIPTSPPDSTPEEMPQSFPEMMPASREAMAGAPELSTSGLLVDSIPGERMLTGNLLERGVVLTVYDDKANVFVSVSGQAPQYGEGGFEIALPHAGDYRVEVRNEVLTIRMGDETVFLSPAKS